LGGKRPEGGGGGEGAAGNQNQAMKLRLFSPIDCQGKSDGEDDHIPQGISQSDSPGTPRGKAADKIVRPTLEKPKRSTTNNSLPVGR